MRDAGAAAEPGSGLTPDSAPESALWLALALAAMAGCVDAVAFLSLHGFFASFMSGNSTRLAIGLAAANRHDMLVAAALIALFVAGVIAGSLLATPRRVLATVAGLLSLSALSASLLSGPDARHLSIALAVPALGAANLVVQRVGKVSVTATYVTGTLVRLGQGLGAALRGGPRWDWAPYAALWLSLMAGAVLGALLFPWAGLRTLWMPATGCAALAATGPHGKRERSPAPD